MDDYVLTKIIQGLLIVAVYIVGAVCGVWNQRNGKKSPDRREHKRERRN